MKIFRRRKFESDMDCVLRFRVDAYVDDLVRSGVNRAETERRARVESLAAAGIAIGIPAVLALGVSPAHCFTESDPSIYLPSLAPFSFCLFSRRLRELCRRTAQAGSIRCPRSDANNTTTLKQSHVSQGNRQ
jgi:hypothetical protein